MAAKEIKRIEANMNLMNAITAAITIAHTAGLSSSDVKVVLEQFASMLEEE
jgi:tellurite resistance protein